MERECVSQERATVRKDHVTREALERVDNGDRLTYTMYQGHTQQHRHTQKISHVIVFFVGVARGLLLL